MVLFVLASCADMESQQYAVVGRVKDISDRDIELAIQAVRQRCMTDRHRWMPVYRVFVEGRDKIEVNCGPHYGSAEAAGALTFVVEKIKDVWRVTDAHEYVPNPERVIVT